MSYIVELEPGVWICDVAEGDPGRTTVEANAQRFSLMADAYDALAGARFYRPFPNANVLSPCPELEVLEDTNPDPLPKINFTVPEYKVGTGTYNPRALRNIQLYSDADDKHDPKPPRG